jgi:DNA-binding response OmpR family regulator
MPTALIVEDEPDANRLLSMLVQLRGFETDSAFTGNEAIAKADDVHPDLVFLDLMLPDVNGYEVCQTLKGRRATTDIPVVMVTARLADENRVQGFRAGASEYIPKPYTPDQIFAALSHADAWRGRIDAIDHASELPLDAREDVAHLRYASDLKSLLLARTRLAEESVRRLGGALSEILQRGVDWGRAHGLGRVATLDVRLDPGRFALTLRDESGWLADDDPRSDGLADLLARSGFSDVDFRDGRDLRLVRDLPGG